VARVPRQRDPRDRLDCALVRRRLRQFLRFAKPSCDPAGVAAPRLLMVFSGFKCIFLFKMNNLLDSLHALEHILIEG
jgi:hypothetical protein